MGMKRFELRLSDEDMANIEHIKGVEGLTTDAKTIRCALREYSKLLKYIDLKR